MSRVGSNDWKKIVDKNRPDAEKLMSVHAFDERVVDECRRAGASIAVVAGNKMVPLVPRHLSEKHLRALFWLGIKELVVYGQSHGDLCCVCMNNITCLQEGLGRSASFSCKTKPDLITIELKKKKKGREHGQSETGG